MKTNTSSSYAGDRSGDTLAQSKALDAIGDALKHQQINFYIATKLRDLVRLGQVDEAQERLWRFQETSKL